MIVFQRNQAREGDACVITRNRTEQAFAAAEARPTSGCSSRAYRSTCWFHVNETNLSTNDHRAFATGSNLHGPRQYRHH